ncbi:MAG: phosphoribosyl-ATP diphosphatase [Anaerolineae bacterium]|nr:phosphoribosyl-ATP diphosphatase [Anaerolineae bacterium]
MSEILARLYAVIQDRQANPREGSYTTQLFQAGLDEIAKKVGEEAIEVVLAAARQGTERTISEIADLTYHTLVLMAQLGITPEQVAAELERRHR